MPMRHNRISVWAHRGFSAIYPENTQLAFEKALEVQSDGIECDIQKTKDNEYVIIHDHHLGRLANYPGYIAQLTLDEIKKMDLGQGQSILTLKELLAFYPAHKSLNIELKSETLTVKDCCHIMSIIKSRKDEIDFHISSFAWSLLPFFKRHGFKIGLLFGEEAMYRSKSEIVGDIISLRPYSLNIPVQVFRLFQPFHVYSTLQIFKILHLKLIFWTINTAEDYKRVKNVADVVITDTPDLFCLAK